MNKKDWHWKCRVFGHKYHTSGGLLSERIYHWDVCVRDGFNPNQPGITKPLMPKTPNPKGR